MFKETKICMHSDKISKDVKLLVFSDIHFSGNKDIKKLEKVLEKIKTYSIDYICIPGDTVDDANINCDYLIKWFSKLALVAPVIISLGNHDIRVKYKECKSYYDNIFWDRVEKLDNVYLLNNNCKSFKDVYFYGFTQSFNYYYEYMNENKEIMKSEMKEYGVCVRIPNKLSVLLMHSPICIGDKKINKELSKYDIVLSGHMHNGVVPPIFDELFNNNRGIIAPNKRVFPKYARGIIKKDNITVISGGITKISNSAGKVLKWLDIFFPISINYIEIKKEKVDFEKSIRYYR